MDDYGRRKLVAGILIGLFLIVALIGEAMMDSTLRNRALGYLGIFWASLIALVALLYIAWMTPRAHAHDAHHPETNDWYMTLKSPGGGPCCDGKDAGHVDDLDWESQNKPASHYRVRIDGKWIDVPDDKVIAEPNRAGFALEWHYYLQGEPVIRCFMPGSMT